MTNKTIKEFIIKKGEIPNGKINDFLDGCIECSRSWMMIQGKYLKNYKVKIEIEEI